MGDGTTGAWEARIEALVWRLARLAACGAGGLLVLAEALSRLGTGLLVDELSVGLGALAVGAALWAFLGDPSSRALVAVTSTVIGASLAVTLAGALGAGGSPGSWSVVAAVPVLTACTVRRTAPVTGVLVAAAAAAALGVAIGEDVGMQWPVPVVTASLLATAFAVGLYLRVLDREADRRADGIRQAERLAIARDLHDAVAHHVTAMVVSAQAARHVADRHPGAASGALAEIEDAGGEALVAMRRLVGGLRDGDGGSRRPDELPEALDALVRAARDAGLPVRLELHDATGTRVPPEVAASLVQVVREGLANARRHAPDATDVHVEVEVGAEGVRVVVRDDGVGRQWTREGSGFGLPGMRERVGCLGGRLVAGPAPSGGWELCAVVPLDAARA